MDSELDQSLTWNEALVPDTTFPPLKRCCMQPSYFSCTPKRTGRWEVERHMEQLNEKVKMEQREERGSGGETELIRKLKETFDNEKEFWAMAQLHIPQVNWVIMQRKLKVHLYTTLILVLL